MTIVRHTNLSRAEMAKKLRAYRNSQEDINYSIHSTGSRTLSVILPGSRRYFYAENR